MGTDIFTVKLGRLSTRELDGTDQADLAGQLAHLAAPGAGLGGALVERSGNTRMIAVHETGSPLAMLPFRFDADGTARLEAFLLHPGVVGREGRIIAAGCDHMKRLGASVIIAVAPPATALERHLLEAGFQPGPHLVEMSCATPQIIPADGYKWTLYGPGMRKLFAEVFYRTLEGSLDAPEVPVCRDGELLMRSFEQRGECEREDFALLEVRSQKAGVVMVSRTGAALEIIYIGVVPEMRGEGLGGVLLERCLWRAHSRGADEIKAFVDALNRPALNLYAKYGFREMRAVSVFLMR